MGIYTMILTFTVSKAVSECCEIRIQNILKRCISITAYIRVIVVVV